MINIIYNEIKYQRISSLSESILGITDVVIKEDTLALSVEISSEFKVFIKLIPDDLILICAARDNKANEFTVTRSCAFDDFIDTLSNVIYDADSAISESLDVKRFYGARDEVDESYEGNAPGWMDIPVWDKDRKCWYDAEY